jgi:hypothetical protein
VDLSGRCAQALGLCALLTTLWSAPVFAEPPGTDLGDPPPPVPPEVISRAENGRVVVRAVRIPEPLRIDGQLDEGVYRTLIPVSGLIQTLPREGAPATEKSDV